MWVRVLAGCNGLVVAQQRRGPGTDRNRSVCRDNKDVGLVAGSCTETCVWWVGELEARLWVREACHVGGAIRAGQQAAGACPDKRGLEQGDHWIQAAIASHAQEYGIVVVPSGWRTETRWRRRGAPASTARATAGWTCRTSTPGASAYGRTCTTASQALYCYYCIQYCTTAGYEFRRRSRLPL